MIQEKYLLDRIEVLRKELHRLILDVDELQRIKQELDIETTQSEVYNNKELYLEKTRSIKTIEEKLYLYDSIATSIELLDLLYLSSELEDTNTVTSILETAFEHLTQLKNILMLTGRYDTSNAIVTIHAGAGGTEACDWTEIIYRMYILYSEKLGYKIQELNKLAGDGAGIKSVTFKISGDYAYGYMKAEKGVHRLVRISPFDSNKRRHTSFTSVEVVPEISAVTTADIVLKDEDLEIGTFRSSGAGGQHVNKTESAVRIVHKPTGITVKCQEERSQIQNKEKALEKLRALLVIDREEKQLEELSQLRGRIKKIEWGSQIRSYVFCPYTLVKDHRTGYEDSDIQRVINGDIQGFINTYLMSINDNSSV